jgi:hypothetical protein
MAAASASASSRDSDDFTPSEVEYIDRINKCKAYITANHIPDTSHGSPLYGKCYRVNNVSLYDFFINNTDGTHFIPATEHSPPLPSSPCPVHLFFLRYNKDQNEYSPEPLNFLKLKLPTNEIDLSFDTNFEEGMRDIPDIYKEGLKLIKVLSIGIYWRRTNVSRNLSENYIIYTTFSDKPLIFSPYFFWPPGFIYTDLPHFILNLQESRADRRPITTINLPGSIEEARSSSEEIIRAERLRRLELHRRLTASSQILTTILLNRMKLYGLPADADLDDVSLWFRVWSIPQSKYNTALREWRIWATNNGIPRRIDMEDPETDGVTSDIVHHHQTDEDPEHIVEDEDPRSRKIKYKINKKRKSTRKSRKTSKSQKKSKSQKLRK